MSWVTEDGLHEGYAAYIAKDGREAVATSADGMVMGHGRYLPDGTWTDGELVPWSDLLGWEARCDCHIEAWPFGHQTTIGPMWRLASVPRSPGHPVVHDPEEARAGDRTTTVEDCIRAWWVDHLEVVGAR